MSIIIKKSYKNISPYLSYMGIREGLSFSDYMDDSVPADVKPVYNLTPMEEREDVQSVDYSTRAKDLFKGLWENMMPNNDDLFKSYLVQLFGYLRKELKLKTIPTVKLSSDKKNADKILGKTAYYNPSKKEIVLYITDRHQKDILRSFAHEVIHHWQHENGKLKNKLSENDPQYAQNDPWMRQMEKQAYLLGNILFRDWSDKKVHGNKRNNIKMSEQHGCGNVSCTSDTPIIKKYYNSSHPYRKYVEGPTPESVPDYNEIDEI